MPTRFLIDTALGLLAACLAFGFAAGGLAVLGAAGSGEGLPQLPFLLLGLWFGMSLFLAGLSAIPASLLMLPGHLLLARRGRASIPATMLLGALAFAAGWPLLGAAVPGLDPALYMDEAMVPSLPVLGLAGLLAGWAMHAMAFRREQPEALLVHRMDRNRDAALRHAMAKVRVDRER